MLTPMLLSQVMAHPNKQCFYFTSLNLLSKLFLEIFIFFKLNCHNLAENHPKVTSWGLESSGPPLEDGHRDV